jgi:hypothetical protein
MKLGKFAILRRFLWMIERHASCMQATINIMQAIMRRIFLDEVGNIAKKWYFFVFSGSTPERL